MVVIVMAIALVRVLVVVLLAVMLSPVPPAAMAVTRW